MRDWKNLVGILLVAAALFTVVVLLAGAGMMGFGVFNTRLGTLGQGMMGGYNLLGWTVMPALWALLVGWLGRYILALAREDHQRILISKTIWASALDILNSTYARGEISKEKFSEMRKNLGG